MKIRNWIIFQFILLMTWPWQSGKRYDQQLSCTWQLCTYKAEGELQDIEFSDGSEDEDTDELRDFGTHALYQLSKFLFPSANLHDKIHLNGMLTMIATHKEQSFDYFVSHDMLFMRAIYCILSNTNVTLPSSRELCWLNWKQLSALWPNRHGRRGWRGSGESYWHDTGHNAT